MPTKSQLTVQIKKQALDMGFHKVGIAAAKPLIRSTYLEEWLKLNRHGTMTWMENYLEKRMDVTKLYPKAKTVIAVAHNYYTHHQHSNNPKIGKISRYAWGKDYHKVIKKKLKHLLKDIQTLDGSIEGRIFVDTAPIQDKLWAQEGGIGWQGKNTNIITREMGSWIFLGEIVINKELAYDQPAIDYCGSCSACIDACPTKALEAYKLDATRCLSYLTIEHRDKPIPDEVKSKMNNWVFGCDICQDVCPWNRFAVETNEDNYQPVLGNVAPDLDELNRLSEDAFKKRFNKSPVYRAKYKNFMRNVRTVIKNIPPR